MNSELIVSVDKKEISISLLEDKKLVEFQQEKRIASFSVGNVYIAKVKKIMQGLNACFVDLGYERDAFLHYFDLGQQFNNYDDYINRVLKDNSKKTSISVFTKQPEITKEGSIQNAIKVGQSILVQIIKEPISTKGPRLTCELSFAGRFLVLIPFKNYISVSSKIKSQKERARLKQLIQSIKPKNFGVIVRTVAEGKRVAELDNELRILMNRWNGVVENLAKQDKLPTLAYEETSRAVALMRDIYNPSYENIYVDNKAVFQELTDYLTLIAPDNKNIVKLYKGQVPIFDNFNVTKQIKTSFGKAVTYKHGAYLIIESTEALHVIDVNSGNRSKSPEGQETNAIDVNLGAADEIARQLRLRDMGGIIVVDFIDMNLAENRQKLYERMCQNMLKDRTRHKILPLSKFGLMQITRQRVRQVMSVNVEEQCPTCAGTGKIKSSILFTDILEEKINTLVSKIGQKKIKLHLHPYVEAYTNQGLLSLKRKWQMKFGFGVKIIPDQNLSFLQYKFYDQKGNEIDMKEENELL